jgi:predicted kinase
MKKLLILKGLPASGKSTFAKEAIAENQGSWKRINKDDLRSMLDNSHHSKGNERFVLETRDFLIMQALRNGKHVVCDDTNLDAKHEKRMRELAKQYEAESGKQVHVEVKFFDVPLEECIKRDLKRTASVGEQVIRNIYKRYLSEGERHDLAYRKQDETLPKAVLCDLDGTLAILQRNPFDASTCEQDLLNEPVANLVKNYQKLGYKIILLSGRMDLYKPQTLRWLEKHEIVYDELLMRKGKDQRKDSIIKREIFEGEIQPKYFVEFVLDDRNQVVDLWRKDLNLPCLQVNYGNF